ncbi:MAG: hypothetical protein H6917_06120 [Novosphingobium sp.]|nr:hypothetical protein [Novosphingobium sp.]MCP5401945.1 hypothetical protein [Novosphingobium sp.]
MSKYLRRFQAADYLQEQYGAYTPETLAKLASVGGGPKFRKMGRYPIYTPDDLDDWAMSRMSPPVSSTSELNDGGNPSKSSGAKGRRVRSTRDGGAG